MLIAIWILTLIGLALWSLASWGLHTLLTLDPMWVEDVEALIREIPYAEAIDRWFPAWRELLGVLMITSKGAAGVTGSGFIVLASTLSALRVVPVEGIALVLGVDRFMSEARAITNLIGNGAATLVVARSEKAFDDEQRRVAIAELHEERIAAAGFTG